MFLFQVRDERQRSRSGGCLVVVGGGNVDPDSDSGGFSRPEAGKEGSGFRDHVGETTTARGQYFGYSL